MLLYNTHINVDMKDNPVFKLVTFDKNMCLSEYVSSCWIVSGHQALFVRAHAHTHMHGHMHAQHTRAHNTTLYIGN